MLSNRQLLSIAARDDELRAPGRAVRSLSLSLSDHYCQISGRFV